MKKKIFHPNTEQYDTKTIPFFYIKTTSNKKRQIHRP